MNDHYYAVIMAGGGGTRLWPLSRKSQPKQVLRLFGDQTLFQVAVRRLEGLFPPQRILVVTIEDQAEILQEQCPEIPRENYLLEPMPRGTAGVVGFAASFLRKRDPQATMAVLTADHFIGNEPEFRRILTLAREVAVQGSLVTLGIPPSYPATGYGYIHFGEAVGTFLGQAAFHVRQFKEKPDLPTAEAFLQSGEYAWNSGMFIWRVDRILEEIERQMPELAKTLDKIEVILGTRAEKEGLAELWPQLVPETVDYGIMEGAQRVAVILADNIDWDDVGSWESLFEVVQGDESGNIILSGNLYGLDTRNTLVYDDLDDGLVVTIGVEDLVIVRMADAVLICRKDQSQRVRDVVRFLQKNEKQRYL